MLSVHGSDFSLIASLMNRKRVQVLRRFRQIEKKEPKLIDAIFEKPSRVIVEPELESDDFLRE